jgi:hypothetical protein
MRHFSNKIYKEPYVALVLCGFMLLLMSRFAAGKIDAHLHDVYIALDERQLYYAALFLLLWLLSIYLFLPSFVPSKNLSRYHIYSTVFIFTVYAASTPAWKNELIGHSFGGFDLWYSFDDSQPTFATSIEEIAYYDSTAVIGLTDIGGYIVNSLFTFGNVAFFLNLTLGIGSKVISATKRLLKWLKRFFK